MHPTITVIESQLDWLTGTAQDEGKRKALEIHAGRLIADEGMKGNRIRDWSFKGYVGYHAGAVSWGEREDGGILRVSGPLSQREFDRSRDLLDNITRLDAAVTVRQEPFDGSLPFAAFNAILPTLSQRGRHPHYTLWMNDEGGATLYIGKRSSEFYARWYNKGVESGDPAYANCWRYEVECKGNAADALKSRLVSGENQAEHIASMVHSHFARRGVVPIFEPEIDTEALRAVHARPTLISTLGWLGRSVRPSAQYLISRGMRRELAEALGVTIVAIDNEPEPKPLPDVNGS